MNRADQARKAMEGYLDGELADRIKGWSPQSQYYDWQSKGVQYRSKTLKSDNSYTYIYFSNLISSAYPSSSFGVSR